MYKVTHFLVPLLLLAAILTPSDAAADYLGSVREAASYIELGSYDQAAQAIERATALNDSDSLAPFAMGIIYLHTGHLDAADLEFAKAGTRKPGNWRVYYAKALTAMLRRRISDAEKLFALARKYPEAREDMDALDLYLAFTKGKNAGVAMPERPTSPLAMETVAIAALRSENSDKAISLLEDILRREASPGFEENRAPLATFDPLKTIVLPNGKLTWRPTERKDAAIVSGVVTLRADLSHTGTSEVNYITFYVDDVFAGATNYYPFQIELNTLNYPNGLHQVRIEGKDENGAIVSNKSLWIKVLNADSGQTVMDGPEAAELEARLWNGIRVTESRKLAYYHLGKIAFAAGDSENAAKNLEYAVAYDPDLPDARKLLIQMRGGQPQLKEVSRVNTGSRLIALTFDDGPNERTAEMLDVLAKLEVPATFFLVGFRAEAQPNLVRAIKAGGHEIESHTYTHPKLTDLTVGEVELELCKAAAVIRAITGKPSLYFRPPGGHSDAKVREAAARQGFTEVFWTISCSPFEGADYSYLADNVISNACEGAVVLMHNGEPATTAALPRIVETLRRQGYRFVTLSELVSHEIVQMPPGVKP